MTSATVGHAMEKLEDFWHWIAPMLGSISSFGHGEAWIVGSDPIVAGQSCRLSPLRPNIEGAA